MKMAAVVVVINIIKLADLVQSGHHYLLVEM
jgi:hypothetical protein